MRRNIRNWIERYRCMDWAVLYLRLFIGGILLFHNIGKVQNYNELIDSYPSLLYLGSSATFVLFTVAEVLLSVLIMMGLWVRISALLLALGMLLSFAVSRGGELQFVYLGIYVFLIVSGGGIYAFDVAMNPSKPRN